MRKIFVFLILFAAAGLNAQDIEWKTLEEAESEMKKSADKPLFIDFYTDWCGWCKTMDRTTFKDPEVISYINSNYIPVKFDAESKQEISFRGKKYKFVRAKGSNKFRGVHSFAYFSLRGNLSYPAYAIINSDGRLLKLLLGYMPKEKFFENLNKEN